MNQKTCVKDIFFSALSSPKAKGETASLSFGSSFGFPRIVIAGAKPAFFAPRIREKETLGLVGASELNESKPKTNHGSLPAKPIGEGLKDGARKVDHTPVFYRGSKRGRAVTIERLSLSIPSHTGKKLTSKHLIREWGNAHEAPVEREGLSGRMPIGVRFFKKAWANLETWDPSLVMNEGNLFDLSPPTAYVVQRKAEWKGVVSWLLLCHALCFALFFRRKRPNESERQGQAIEKKVIVGLALAKVTLDYGYLLADDLTGVVNQFYSPPSGEGWFSLPPTLTPPPDNSFLELIPDAQIEGDSPAPGSKGEKLKKLHAIVEGHLRRYYASEDGLKKSRNVVSDSYAIRKKSSTEENPVTSKWRGKISRDSYLIPFQWLNHSQWRKLKNPWFLDRTLFHPSCFGTGKKKWFFAQLVHSAGPTCISYLAEEASDMLDFLPSWDSMDQDLFLLYGQYRSTLVDHMDVEKATNLDEIETSLLHFYLPSSYLCFGSGAYKWNICYAIRTVRLPELASLSLQCRGRSIPKKGSSYLKGIAKRASSLFRISVILSASVASSISSLHVFHSKLPPLTRTCLRLDRLNTSYIRRIIPFSSCDPIVYASAEYSNLALAASSVSSHYSNNPEADLSFVFVVAHPYLVSFPKLTSPTTFLYVIRRKQVAVELSRKPAPTKKHMKMARQANARTVAFKPERGPGLGIGLGATIEFVQSKGKGDDYQF
ncbi:hypothetical protein H5410_051167 [Solanum commersonii]|uniref:Uncharacterized protein n=1 Tax=Solanum commersonii TaxID=4109 RepID=A0A9J5WZR1_SOLCO|nr:hypothetical protein H5410_051167 [Solanum commersonii]